MYDFYTAIFDKVREKENWQQPSFLNVQLQEAVGQRYPEDSSRYCQLHDFGFANVLCVCVFHLLWAFKLLTGSRFSWRTLILPGRNTL